MAVAVAVDVDVAVAVNVIAHEPSAAVAETLLTSPHCLDDDDTTWIPLGGAWGGPLGGVSRRCHYGIPLCHVRQIP